MSAALPAVARGPCWAVLLGLGALGMGAFGLGCDPPCPASDGDGLGQLAGWEQDFIDEGGQSPAPPPAFLEGEEGVWLAYREWSPPVWDGSGDVALVIHGSSAHSALYTVWAEALAENGIHARLIDLRGHGLSLCTDAPCSAAEPPSRDVIDDGRYFPGRIGDSLDTHQIVRDVAQHIADLQARWPAARVHLIGHSSGGGVVARYIEQAGAHAVASVALVAPFLHAEQRHAAGEVDLACPDDGAYAQVDAGALGAALRGDIHRYVLRFDKAPAYRDPLDTLHNSYTTMTGMQVSSLDSYRSAFVRPTLWVAAEHDALFDVELSRAESRGLPAQRAFVLVRDTSHIGLIWSRAVGALLADWVRGPDGVVDQSEISGGP